MGLYVRHVGLACLAASPIRGLVSPEPCDVGSSPPWAGLATGATWRVALPFQAPLLASARRVLPDEQRCCQQPARTPSTGHSPCTGQCRTARGARIRDCIPVRPHGSLAACSYWPPTAAGSPYGTAHRERQGSQRQVSTDRGAGVHCRRSDHHTHHATRPTLKNWPPHCLSHCPAGY